MNSAVTDSTPEGRHMERKSLRKVAGDRADFADLARSCVCFANGSGGQIQIGIEDGETAPLPGQRIDAALLDQVQRRIGELTINVHAVPELRRHENGGDYIALHIPRSPGVASTSDGRYFLRVGDSCSPVVGDDVMRLADERAGTPWEALSVSGTTRASADSSKVDHVVETLRSSDRVKASVKEKSVDELLDHYGLANAGVLTNLGVLLIGRAGDRARLGSAPVVQAIKYDEQGTKVGKYVWDDYTLSPIELLEVIWREIPDFKEAYDVPLGMLRIPVPAFDEAVVRELMVNALVHRPYTQRGDIFLNLHPDRLEAVNPGRLPLGVTPQNILHASRRRNDRMAQVFHDLKLMEREGSGFDLLYERLLASGRGTPTVKEGADSVHVTVPRRMIHPGVIRLLSEADQRHHLSQRERIALGLLAQGEGMSALDLATKLDLKDPADVRSWIGRLPDFGLISQAGRTKGTRYFVPPELLRMAGFDVVTTLVRVQPHRLRALIIEDLERFPDSGRADINRRIGLEIQGKAVSRSLETLVKAGVVITKGDRRWRTYRLRPSQGQNS